MQRLINRAVSMFGIYAAIGMLLFTGVVFGQTDQENYIKDMRWRNIGPANMSGRVSDIEAVDGDFTKVFVASASGGVWKSVNAGTAWEPIFDNYGAASIGDIAIYQRNPDIIWVGTGEANDRNSVAWGNGIYKSTDGGRTFENMGLEDTHQIGRVITHPTNPDIVYVAAVGHLWGYSGERGLFKTTDGGNSWEKLTNGLPSDEKTGAIDLIINPDNPNHLIVSFWQRLRQPYRFDSGGPGSGIFKTTNGGSSWTELRNGLPEGDLGRIGLAWSRSNPDVVMAIVEHSYQPRQGRGGRGGGGRGGGQQPTNPDYTDMTKLGTGIYRSENGGRSWGFVNRYNNRPFYYSQIRINPVDDQKVYLVTGRFMMSDDGGKTLRRGADGIHVDHHAMWLDPNNKDRFYLGNDGGSYLTHDNGETFQIFDNFVISQFYAVGVDMRDPYYVYGGLQDNGTWSGPSRSRDSGGIFTDHWKSVGGGDGFHAQSDPTDWTTLYVESQGGSISRRNLALGTSQGIRPSKNNIVNWDEYVTEEILQTQLEKGFTARGRGGRGGFGGGGGGDQGEQPPPPQGNPFRFNWSSPIVLSPHNPHTIFFGGNHLFKSVNRGDSWQIISPDLSKNDPIRTRRETGGITRDVTGAETHGAIITVSESPLTPGLIWVGTDDGNVQLSRNGGINWSNVRNNVPGVPEQLWVSRIEASHFEEGTAYLTFDGHRSDNFTPWVFKTTNYGQNWTNISNNIPGGHAVYVIKEDLKNPNLLFVGTEFAVFYSTSGGDSWTKLNVNMPTVAVHDLVIHPRDGDLIAATHGRGIWIMDDITPLQQLTGEVKEQDAHLFDIRSATIWRNMNRGGSRGHFLFRGENPTNTPFITYYIKPGLTGEVKIEISNLDGSSKRSITEQAEPGINKVAWNGQFDTDRQNGRGGRGGGRGGRGRGRGGFNTQIGQYLVKMTFQGETYSTTLTVRRDPIETGGGN